MTAAGAGGRDFKNRAAASVAGIGTVEIATAIGIENESNGNGNGKESATRTNPPDRRKMVRDCWRSPAKDSVS